MNPATGRGFALAVAGLAGVRLFAVVAGFAVSIIGARLLDQAAFGAAGVAITLGMIAALICNGGVNISTIYQAKRSPDRHAEVLQSSSAVAIAGSAVAILVVVAAGPALAPALKLDGRLDLFVAAAAVAVGVLAFEYGGAALLAITRPRAFSASELIRSLAALGMTALLLIVWRSDVAFVLAMALSYIVAAAVALFTAQRVAGSLMPAWRPDLLRPALAMGIRGQAGNVLQFLNLRLDLLMIPALLELSAAGTYLVAVRVSEVIAQVGNAAASLIFPAVAGQAVRETALTENTIRVSLGVVVVAAVLLAVLSEPLLALAFGPEYAPAADSVRILAVAMVPLTLTRILAGDLKGRGRAGLVSVAMLCALIVTAGLNLLLIPPLGIAGAAIASLVAYLVSATVLLIAFQWITGARLQQMVPRPQDARMLARAARSLASDAR